MNRAVVRAPGRVNLIGDHTDYTGGLVLPIAVDRWTSVSCEPSGDGVGVMFSSADGAGALHLDRAGQVVGEVPDWGRYVAAVAAEVAADTQRSLPNVTGAIATTIPIGAGMSSSAALEVAVALALGDSAGPVDIARRCQRAEHRAVGVPSGIMDQLVVCAARAGHALAIDCATLEMTDVAIGDDAEIGVRFVTHRRLESSGYAERVAECAAAERVIGPLRDATVADVDAITDRLIRARARHVVTENQRVRDAIEALRAGEHASVGELMNASHASLAADFATSTPAMDAAAAEAQSLPGVYGARMTGGGFGGCLVALGAPGAFGADWWIVDAVDGAVTARDAA